MKRLRTAAEKDTRDPRVVLISQWFTPEPVVVPMNIATALRAAGLSVHVITGVPNYPTGVVPPGFSARRYSSERVNGFPVDRCPLYPSHDLSAARRLLNYFSWAASATLRALTRVNAGDTLLVYSSPATAALPAIACRLLKRAPFVVLIQDLWPDSVLATGFVRNAYARRVAESLISPFTRMTYRLANKVAVISPGMLELLVSRGVPREKLALTYNWADESTYFPRTRSSAFRASLGVADETTLFMYAGNLGPAQALATVIEAAASASETHDIALVIVGSGVTEVALRELADRVAPEVVTFRPPMQPCEVAEAAAAADVQVVSLDKQPVFTYTMPSKVQSVLASGSPVVASADGDIAQVVLESGAGWVAPAGDVDRLAEAMRSAAEAGPEDRARRGACARHYYESYMSEKVNAGALASLLRSSHPGARGSGQLPPAADTRTVSDSREGTA
ncbi:glycosyltransferase family 4 protein [Isoptericola sp. b441]|uniref:D-inositol 3-phosphate glycosyltransferase n=1 Tax=Actinotalea lenta TaxID=3064654 RepID=A0ABT9DC81_9CELL|nr:MULTISPECIES: glycosyltransferase family 4 protein [unclassified Isoptericola]MDO8108513.1 glycosyltransferase family 4 protein [Isoptericola sp. b441]MDO8119923.1 glycosyltransferase family 4 protein [Isoptericola sp. b490]